MTGQAIVFLRDGRSYVASTVVAGRWVHGRGARRRVRNWDTVQLRAPQDRSWHDSQIREIRWEDELACVPS